MYVSSYSDDTDRLFEEEEVGEEAKEGEERDEGKEISPSGSWSTS